MHPFYVIRGIGGVLFITGYLLMIYNVWMTIRSGEEAVPVGQPSMQPAE